MTFNKSAWKSLVLVLALFASVATGACRVRQTEEGKMPDVDVSAEGGKVPEYDVDAADVDVKAGTETREIEVPTVDVDVEPPADGDQDANEGNRPPQQ